MNALKPPPRIKRLILVSFKSAFVAWVLLNVFILAWAIIAMYHHIGSDTWILPLAVAIYSAIIIFCTWFVVLLPLYIFVPQHTLLWRWHVSIPFGIISGAGIMFLLLRYNSPQATNGTFFVILAALTGGLVGLFASFTSRRFQHNSIG